MMRCADRVSCIPSAICVRWHGWRGPAVLLQVFLQDGQLYAFKGLAGRLGPIGVHVALLMCLFGTGYSGFGGWKGTALCPEGGEFLVANALYPASRVSTLPSGAKAVMQVGGRCWGVCDAGCEE